MSSKISGYWPQGHSTSRPYTRIVVIAPGGPFIVKPTLDMALTMSGAQREDFIEWLLDERRKELMMERHYRDEMCETVKDMPLDFEHPWMTDGQKMFRLLRWRQVLVKKEMERLSEEL